MTALVMALLQCCAAAENPLHPPLLYLARHQNENGSWGERPGTCGCSPRSGPEQPVWVAVDDEVQQAFDFLLGGLDDDDGRAREQAQRAILRLGARTIPLLQAELRHPVLEVRERCRDTLHRLYRTNDEARMLSGRHRDDLRATSLALLAFTGSGYVPASKDWLRDPLSGTYTVGDIMKKALGWILSKQDAQGSFSTDDPVANALAALALSELFGMTVTESLREPAKKAIAFVVGCPSTDRAFVLWKGMLLESAWISDLRPRDAAGQADLARRLRDDPSIPGRFGQLLLRNLAGTGALLTEPPPLKLDALSPEELYIVAMSLRKLWGKDSKEWRAWRETLPVPDKESSRQPGCERGSWGPERISATAFQTLLLHRSYEYACALLNSYQHPY